MPPSKSHSPCSFQNCLLVWGVHLSVSYLFTFSYCSWGSQGKNTEVVCHSLLQWITFCQISPPIPTRLGWPHRAWLSFIELNKPVVRVIRLASFLWLWFQCVCPLMPSRNTYHLTWVSLTLDVGYLFTAAPAKRSCCSLPWTRVISSQPSCDCTAAPDLRLAVAPLSCRLENILKPIVPI